MYSQFHLFQASSPTVAFTNQKTLIDLKQKFMIKQDDPFRVILSRCKLKGEGEKFSVVVEMEANEDVPNNHISLSRMVVKCLGVTNFCPIKLRKLSSPVYSVNDVHIYVNPQVTKDHEDLSKLISRENSLISDSVKSYFASLSFHQILLSNNITIPAKIPCTITFALPNQTTDIDDYACLVATPHQLTNAILHVGKPAEFSFGAVEEFCEVAAPGFGKVAKQILKMVKLRMGWPQLNECLNAGGGGGILICGERGSGKTTLLQHLRWNLSQKNYLINAEVVNCKALVQRKLSDAKLREYLQNLLDKCTLFSPSVLILDGLDYLVPLPDENSQQKSNTAVILCNFAKEIRARSRHVYLIASVNHETKLHPIFQSNHTFSLTLSISPLTKDQREEILVSLLKSSSEITRKSVEFLDINALSRLTESTTPSDLKSLVERATVCAVSSLMKRGDTDYNTVRLTNKDFEEVKGRSTVVESSVQWDDIGGLKEAKRLLMETLDWPSKYSELFKSCPLRLRSGILLYGYPGCGKTMLASAVAKECGINFIAVKGPELLNKYIGSSEKAVRDLFERAQAESPCILFFDEFDAIAPK
ncbi:Peroxisome biosynthesis protein pex1, partial [Nowakowskiella sp. JEL0407]